MSESENSNLDSYFKRRAQQANIEFNEDDWLHLEARLNDELPLKPTFWYWLRKYWYAPLILILVPAVWFAISGSNSTTIEVQNKTIDLSSVPMTDAQDLTETKVRNKIQLDSKENDLNEKRTESKVNDPANPNDANSETRRKPQIKRSSIQGNSNELKSPGKLNDSNAGSEKSILDTNDKGYVVLGNGDEAPRLSGTSFPHFLSQIAPSFYSNSEAPESLPLLDIEPDAKKQFRRYITVGVGYSPDFSTVGMHNFIAPGTRWKVDLGYTFSPRFQLLSGVVFVNNKYEAYGDEYHAPALYWKNGIVSDETYGECKMIDIPLNIRYNFITSGRHRAFVSSGASTYFLTKEDYYFDYYQDYPDSPEHWGTDKTSVYPFSIVNFSVGYEYTLKGRGSFQVEPYIKIPTGGVGWGNVDLYTIGVYFSYQYRFWP